MLTINPQQLPKEISDKRREPKSKEHRDKISKSLIGRKRPDLSGNKHWHWSGGKPNCIDCGKKVKLYKAKRCCSCYYKFNTGANNPNWKGGIANVNYNTRNGLDYKLWRKTILERDNFTCQKCGKKGGKLIAHHINNFAEFPELRLVIGNGILFCKECHMKFHNKYRRHNNTKEQLEEFLC